MKAAVIWEHGGPEKVGVEDIPAPQAGPGEVVVNLRAAALNHLDLWVIAGGRVDPPKPHVIGSDGAGTVAAVGEGVAGWTPGDEVVISPGLFCGVCEWCLRGQQSECVNFSIFGVARPGTFAEQVAVPARNLHPKPAALSFEEVAALPVAYTTAYRMLLGRAELRPGETVLIHGIGGGVALAALQFAKLIGAEAIVTSSSEAKLKRAQALGADHTINYRATPDVAAVVRELTGSRGVDVAFDAVGAATWPVDLAATRRGGRVVLCGITAGREAPTDLRAVYWNHLTILGSTFGSVEEVRQMLRAVAGSLKPVIDVTLPLAQAPEALSRLALGDQFGKTVLLIPG